MRILVIGGMHGNEPLGIDLVTLLRANPVKDVETLLGNELAIEADVRFLEKDLNRAFPGDPNSEIYEERRAAEMLEVCSEFDIVFDFHNTHCPGNNCTFVGESAFPVLFDISGWLDLKRVTVADYDCVNKYALNCLSVEISLGDPLSNAEYWRGLIAKLSLLDEVPACPDIERYRFVHRITLDEAEHLGIIELELEAFVPLASSLADQLGVASPAYPIFIRDRYTPYNFGGLLNRIE